MTSNHTTEPSDEDRELLASVLLGTRNPAQVDFLMNGESAYRPIIDEALRAIAKARTLSPSPDDRIAKDDFRCHNCKRIVRAVVAPKRCPDCKCSSFSACATTRLAASREGVLETALREVRTRLAGAKMAGGLNTGWFDMLDRIEAALASPAPMPAREQVTIPKELYDFLMGTGEIDGTSFGDLNAGLPGRFWWRALLGRAALGSKENGK